MTESASDLFTIELLEQHWLEPHAEMDPCTHGRLRLVINGVAVLDGESEESDEIGVSKTALALSRTLVRDHVQEASVAPLLVFHACGFAATLEVSCGIGANWWVKHDDGIVRLSEVTRFDGPGGEPVVRFPTASCAVPAEVYRQAVVTLGRAALEFAARSLKLIEDPLDLSEWQGWQEELRRSLADTSA